MNDKIRDLMRSAIISVDCITGDEHLDDEISKMYIPDCFAEKFAELIVRECIEIVEASKVGFSQVPAEVALDLTAKNINSYFGIKNERQD